MSKPHIKYILAADHITADKKNKVIIVGAFDTMSIPKEGLVYSFGVVAQIENPSDMKDISVVIDGPEGFHAVSRMKIPENYIFAKKATPVFNFKNILFKDSGIYKMSVETDGKKIDSKDSYSFDAIKIN